MKKIISVLAIMMIVACSVFAATGDLLNINAKVPATDPIYSLKGGLSNATGTASTGTAASGTITTDVDISTTDIYIYVEVFQTAKAKPTKGGSLTLTGTPLAYSSSSTDDPVVTKITAGTGANFTVTPGATGSETATFTVAYAGKNVPANTTIGSAVFKWTHKDELEVGESNNYTATITLTYEVK